MMHMKRLDIAAVGDEDLVNGLRLAGISRYYVIEGDRDAREDVRKALSELIDEPNVGIVVILEDYVRYVEDLVTQVRQGKRTTPVIIEVPSKFGTTDQDVRQHYKAYAKRFIGFEVEI